MQEINLLVEQKNGTVGINFEEIKAALAHGLEEYKHMVFTEDSKKEAKATVASLRKLKKSLNDKKMDVKKSFMAPYMDFETQVKELDALIDEPISFINEQIDEFERKRVEEKQEQIREIYNSVIKEHESAADYIPLHRIYDNRWENATTTKKAIEEAVMQHVENVEKDLATIHSMESEFEDKAIERYKSTLELSDAIGVISQYQKQKEYILKRQQEEGERKKEEAVQNARGQIPETPFTQNPMEQKDLAATSAPKNDESVMYEVVADPFQLAQLESAMREYGIKYRRVQ